MPKQVLTRRRSLVAKLTVLAVIASLLAIAIPASAAIDTSASCPSTIPSSGFTDLGGLDATTVLAINCLVHYGITQGTSATTFTPNGSVSRWQMALFLTRQAVDHGITLPDGSSQGFADIGGFDAATQTAINQLAQLEITQGTSATTFEPNLVVSRWQMALFLTRLADAAGVTLPSGAPQGFLDILTLSVEAQLAINQAKQLGIADGFSATQYSPFTDTLRWQMALFLTRTLAVDGVLPTGLGFTVTAFDLVTDVITYDNNGTSATVDYTGGTSFTVDGAAASIGVFEANLSVGDKIAFTGTSFALTNVTVTGGLVNDVKIAGNTFDIILSSGAILTNDRTYVAANTTYSVGGVVASELGFESSLSNGDTISITGAGTAASPFVFALTNGTATGTVSGVAGAVTWNITTSGGAVLGVNDLDVPGGDVLTLTVDGVPATQPTFEAAISNGDAITYGRASGTVTASLSNQASAPSTGRVLAFDTVANTITIDAGPAVGVTTADYSPVAVIKTVNGVASTEAELEAALNIGDTVTYQAASTTPAVAASIVLVDNTVSGTPNTIDPVADEITLWFDANGPDTDVIVYTDPVDANIVNFLGLSNNVAVVYQINGAVTTEANFEAAVAGIIGGLSGSVAVTDSGTNTVWNVTSP